MTVLHLEEKLRTGIAVIDEQHAGLIAIHVEIEAGFDSQRPPHHTIELMARLYQQSCLHFETEETIMEEFGFPDLEEHRAEHQQLIERLRSIILKYRQSGDAITPDMAEFIRSWILEHIEREDLVFAAFAAERSGTG